MMSQIYVEARTLTVRPLQRNRKSVVLVMVRFVPRVMTNTAYEGYRTSTIPARFKGILSVARFMKNKQSNKQETTVETIDHC